MNIYVFNHLAMDERAQYALQNAAFLKSIEKGNKSYSFYDAKDFYIRIEFDHGTNTIVQVKSFKSDAPLEKYLENIHLVNLD